MMIMNSSNGISIHGHPNGWFIADPLPDGRWSWRAGRCGVVVEGIAPRRPNTRRYRKCVRALNQKIKASR